MHIPYEKKESLRYSGGECEPLSLFLLSARKECSLSRFNVPRAVIAFWGCTSGLEADGWLICGACKPLKPFSIPPLPQGDGLSPMRGSRGPKVRSFKISASQNYVLLQTRLPFFLDNWTRYKRSRFSHTIITTSLEGVLLLLFFCLFIYLFNLRTGIVSRWKYRE